MSFFPMLYQEEQQAHCGGDTTTMDDSHNQGAIVLQGLLLTVTVSGHSNALYSFNDANATAASGSFSERSFNFKPIACDWYIYIMVRHKRGDQMPPTVL